MKPDTFPFLLTVTTLVCAAAGSILGNILGRWL